MIDPFEQFAECLPEPVLLVNADGVVTAANTAASQLLGMSRQVLAGARLDAVLADDPTKVKQYLAVCARNRTSIPGSFTLRSDADEPTELRADGSLLAPAEGEQPTRLLLRLRHKSEAVSRFVELSRQVAKLNRQVAQRQLAQEELYSQREWLRVTLSSIGDAVITTDTQERVTFMNAVGEKLTGWRKEEALGRPMSEVFNIINESTRQPAENVCQKVLRSGLVVGLANHTALISRDGRELPIEDSAAPIFDRFGTILGTIMVFHDVTERRWAQRAIEQQEQWLRVTLSSIGDAVITTDTEGRVTFVNAAAEEVTGWSSNEAIGRDIDEVFHVVNEQNHQPMDSVVAKVLRSGNIVGMANHTLLIRRDGRELPIDDSGSPIRSSDGQVIGVVLVFRDVSGRRTWENALRESEARFRTMADSAPVLVWMSNIDGGCEYFNKPWLDFTGRTMDQERGNGWAQGVHPEDYQPCSDIYLNAFKHREPFRMEFRLRRADGEYRWMLNTGLPRFASGGDFIGYIGTCIDITERRQAEQQLLAMNETLEQRVAERTEVAEQRAMLLRELAMDLTHAEQRERRRLAQVLHDHLQQLLVAAKLRMGMLGSRLKKYPETEGSLEQVDELVGQAIEASRSLTAELSPTILHEGGLAASLEWLARRQQENHGLTVRVKADPDADPRLEDVAALLFQAVRELLFNVVKHANAKEASVTMSLRSPKQVQIVVEDHGDGFDPQTIEQRAEHDVGFGLFNLKRRFDLLGGEMTIDSKPDQGCCVTLVAPLGREPVGPDRPAESTSQEQSPVKEDQPAPSASRGDAIRVLLVDDHKILRAGLVNLLREQADIDVVGEASNGEEAVQQAQRLRPDVIVMDISMPILNGVEATRIIKREMPEIYVIGLSMHEREDMSSAMREAGAGAFLSKVGPAHQLLNAIRAHPSHA